MFLQLGPAGRLPERRLRMLIVPYGPIRLLYALGLSSGSIDRTHHAYRLLWQQLVCLPLSLPGFSVSMQRRHHCHPEQAVVHGPAHDSRPSSARQQRMENEVCACLSVQSRDSSHGWCPLTMDIALTMGSVFIGNRVENGWGSAVEALQCSDQLLRPPPSGGLAFVATGP